MLKIEQELQRHAANAFTKYSVLRQSLEPIYSYAAAGFPVGNDHGFGHINRVIEKLNSILGDAPCSVINERELFLTLVSILYHDIAILTDRAHHVENGAKFVAQIENNDFLLDSRERDVIAAAVASHGGKCDINERCSFLPSRLRLDSAEVRPKVVASLVRLADELDEDYRRANPIARSLRGIPAESDFYWDFGDKVSGIVPDQKTQTIAIDIRILDSDLSKIYILDKDKVPFLLAIGRKLAKINRERSTTAAHLPDAIRYEKLYVTVYGAAGSTILRRPRTFSFIDETTPEDFASAFSDLTELAPARHPQIIVTSAPNNMASSPALGTSPSMSVAQQSPPTVYSNGIPTERLLGLWRGSWVHRANPRQADLWITQARHGLHGLMRITYEKEGYETRVLQECAIEATDTRVIIHANRWWWEEQGKATGWILDRFDCAFNSQGLTGHKTDERGRESKVSFLKIDGGNSFAPAELLDNKTNSSDAAKPQKISHISRRTNWWDRLLGIWPNSKTISILGQRGVGKTTLFKFMQTGHIDRNERVTIAPTNSTPIRLDTESGSIAIRQLTDVPGSRDALVLWKESFKDADILFYLFRADRMVQQDANSIAQLRNDLLMIQQWTEELEPPRIILIGTHKDLLSEYVSEEAHILHSSIDVERWKKLKVPALLIGSLADIHSAEKLVIDLLRAC